MLAWIEQKNNGVLLRVLIQAGASTTEITALHGDPPRLKIRLAAPPRDGEANAALLRYLKTCLKPL
ncbi:MAG: DUF167 domain-containing protein, partial [Oligoflexales bacterium]|nr:DUF167 domain-containing protein [Oligoflexales bacterium]